MRPSRFRNLFLAGAFAASLGASVGVQNALAADPEEAHYNAVVALYNAGQWQAAITKIEEREKLAPPDPMRAKYLYAKALAFEKGDKKNDARGVYDQLLEKFPKAPEADTARVAVIYLDYAKSNAPAVVVSYPKLDQAKLTPADKKNLSLMYAESLYTTKADDKITLAAYKAAIALGADAKATSTKLFDLYLKLGMHADLLAVTAAGLPDAAVKPDIVALARTEAFLSTSKFAEADAEGQKIPATSELYPRAAFARAQALIRLNKLKDAVEPLKAAIAGMKNPPAPPAANIALAECLIEAGQADVVPKALDAAERAAERVPEADRAKFNGQIALLRLRTATGDRKKLIKAVAEARASAPKEQLPKILYMRLFALSEENERKAILETMKDDYAILQTGPEDGPSTLIYFNAMKESQPADALKLLTDFIARKPATPEAAKARLLLANAALEKNDQAGAKAQYDALAADAKAPASLGKNAFDEAMFNRGVVMQKLNDQAGAAKAYAALVAAKPDADLLAKTLPLLGQAYALQKDYANAAATWKQALAAGKVANEADLRDRLARVLVASNNHAGAIEQFAAEAALLGGEAKLPRESREAWAHSLFASGKFAEAAAAYQALAKSFPDSPGFAYECAASFDRAGQRAEAGKWYAAAQAGKAKLPANYAAAVDTNLAITLLETGTGDMGAAYWLEQIAGAKDEASFDRGVAAVRKITAAKPDPKINTRLTEVMAALPVDQPRHYTIGAMILQNMAAAKQVRESAPLSEQLAAQFAENEKKLDAKSSGATVAPATIYFFRGEALRLTDHFADALVAYETVLSAYPYNEWPDAAACGEAECLLALGDKEGAVKKFKDVLAVTPPAPASAPWRELATKRIAELAAK
jgi:tetratricopeptide (TPR) repeat protein